MKKWFVVLILGAAQFVMVLDSTVMNVSISAVVEDLDSSVTAMQSAITFYTLTMAATMLPNTSSSAIATSGVVMISERWTSFSERALT